MEVGFKSTPLVYLSPPSGALAIFVGAVEFVDLKTLTGQNNIIELRKFKNCSNVKKNIQLFFLKNRAHMWDDMDQEVKREQFKGNDLAYSIWRLIQE
jgi:hypothetical protein